MSPPRGRVVPRALADRGAALAAALYLVLALLFWGLPVLGHLGSRVVASDGYDSSAYMWMFAWWPHALLHGQNPLMTHAIFTPQGVNLAWANSMPLTIVLLGGVVLYRLPRTVPARQAGAKRG